MKEIRNIVLHLFIGMVLSLTISSCDKLPEDGDFDGMWQLMSIQQYPSGVTENVKDERIYWCERNGLLQFSLKNGKEPTLYAHVRLEGNMMHVYDLGTCLSHNVTKENIVWVAEENSDSLKYWGLWCSPETEASHKGRLRVDYVVERLNSDDMILRSDSTRLVFRSF